MTKNDTKSLFLQYINTFNVGLTKHKDEIVYKQILELGEKILGDKLISVEVHSEDASNPVDYFTIRLNAGTFDVVSHEQEESELVWKLKDTYLQHVVDNPHDYVEHPEKFEWDWLKSYLGM
ncbi:MAG: hypothetical protein NPIRA04_19530 [Nitrospirales bacterium]|nr:MAG: hypothetical protein NPIRA04_19530 [Nitrospirales bacterium]